MGLYNFLRRYVSARDATMLMAAWYGVMLVLVFLGLSATGVDLRYANL